MDEELRDLGAMRLVGREGENHLHGADELAVGERGEKQTAAALDLGDNSCEHRPGVVVRKRSHEADRRTTVDAVREHTGEPVEMLARGGRVETSDLHGIAHATFLRRGAG